MLQKLIADYCAANVNNAARLAEACGVSQRTVRNWRGEIPCSRAASIAAVLDHIGAPPEMRRAAWADALDVKQSEIARIVGVPGE